MRTLLVTPLLLALLPILAACETLTGILAPNGPVVSEAQIVRVLCARDAKGEFIFGPVPYDRLADTPQTIVAVEARNDAWDAATKIGTLCPPSQAGLAPKRQEPIAGEVEFKPPAEVAPAPKL